VFSGVLALAYGVQVWMKRVEARRGISAEERVRAMQRNETE
jgi:hypothetical protein